MFDVFAPLQPGSDAPLAVGTGLSQACTFRSTPAKLLQLCWANGLRFIGQGSRL